ncbi:hypothetical protein [Frigoriglobus tundricola]|uniref:Uncharacterized protein n=1 Tax=Frigoriglobus tundricola TaxID=2774151 RepID=A0A6M5YQI1_9BACT|nr:hypothetical protein [Frigoriglobus tundricola]QJW95501.1 hypothetical protein FTUN_3050 [Frigoriglobus tundricola]
MPLPHHVPQYAGGVSLRYAMVHDVIHERFPKHGPAHYRERNRLTTHALAALAPDAPAAFPLADDLAAGLERLGRPNEAVTVVRDKLARQQAKGITGRPLYTSYANLGTFLIHTNAQKALAGDPAARDTFREGVGLVRKSVEVNPEAHFGRERWQAAVAEFLLAAMDNPSLLRTFDCLGNRLERGIEEILNRETNWVDTGYGRATDVEFSKGHAADEVPGFFEPGTDPADPARWAELSRVRRHVTKVGAEHGWDAVPVPSHRQPVPFDEPVLGIIGMWRQGGGANPHFALAIGEVMLRVGQRNVAWAAFERASRLADRYPPDRSTQEFLREHCRKRQTDIERTLMYTPPADARGPAWQNVSPPLSPADVADLRPRFEGELAHGEGYQRAYQQYEEQRITAGVSLDDPHFFDAFHAGREPIASPVGPEEWFVWVPRGKIYEYAARQRRAWGAFGAGLAAILAATLMRWRAGHAAGGSEIRSEAPRVERTELGPPPVGGP